ncbi:hypothetical protein FRC20_011433 [Serendipita sp. 405]|nr:hypothetical protein FRC16_003085 [Serendipita sp. 398]KAG8861890.1 hypothetical protein FRC20_011433 [Serendipita sp. 405]
MSCAQSSADIWWPARGHEVAALCLRRQREAAKICIKRGSLATGQFDLESYHPNLQQQLSPFPPQSSSYTSTIMERSPLDRPIMSWEEFDRIFDEAFNPNADFKKLAHTRETSTGSTNTAFSLGADIVRTGSPELVLSDASVDAGDSFAGFISEEEIPKIYTPLAFPTIRKESSDSLRSDSKLTSSMSSPKPKTMTIPKRPRVMSNQISSRRTISSAGSVPRLSRRNTKPRVQVETSSDGVTTSAILDVPDILKDSLNVDFHQDHLIATWRTATVTEKVLKDSMIRERKEKRYTQTIIIPEGTKFDTVRATLKSRQLTISFPTNPKAQIVEKAKEA